MCESFTVTEKNTKDVYLFMFKGKQYSVNEF